MKQGDAGEALYLVHSGAAEVVLENGGIGLESLAVLGSNECFGEMALFTGEQRSATVRAFVDSAVLKLNKEDWEELISKHPSLRLHITIDSWFILYQTEYSQIAYYSTDEKAFSHSQGQKLMVAKFLISFLVVAISIRYRRISGFIQ